MHLYFSRCSGPSEGSTYDSISPQTQDHKTVTPRPSPASSDSCDHRIVWMVLRQLSSFHAGLFWLGETFLWSSSSSTCSPYAPTNRLAFWCLPRDPVPRLPGAPITKRRVQHKPHECLNPTSVSKQRCRDSCGLSSSFVGARYGKNRITRHTKRQLKLGTRRQK